MEGCTITNNVICDVHGSTGIYYNQKARNAVIEGNVIVNMINDGFASDPTIKGINIVTDDQSAVAAIAAEIDAVGGRLLSVHPVRRSLEEIFLKEVGHVEPGQGPEDIESTVSSLLDAVGVSSHERTSDEGSKSVEIPS